MTTLLRSASSKLSDRAKATGTPALAVTAVVFLAQGLVFIPLSVIRFVDGDEGSYALAAKLVMQGELPYRDFVYPQMPLLPYVYGTWTAILGESWYGVRILSALFAMGLGALLYRSLASRFGPGLGALGVALYSSSALAFFWYPTLKTYVVPTFLLFAAYALVARFEPFGAPRWLAAGLLVALAVDSRLIFASAIPAFVWAALRGGEHRARLRSLIALVSGGLIGLAPVWFFAALHPSRFAYDALGAYERQGNGLVGDFGQKLRVVENLLGIGTPADAAPQFLLLVIWGLTAVIGLRALGMRIPLSIAVAACLGVGNLAPTPTYAQYFCTTVPFLVVATVEFVAALRTRLRRSEDALLLRAFAGIVAACALVYIAIGGAELLRSAGLYRDQRIQSTREVARIVDEQTAPGERVLASWPGYLFETDAAPVKGLESDFAPTAAARLTPAEAKRHLRASVADVERLIQEHATRLLVVKLWHVEDPAPDWWGTAERSGYRVLTEIPAGNSEVGGAVLIYVFEGG